MTLTPSSWHERGNSKLQRHSDCKKPQRTLQRNSPVEWSNVCCGLQMPVSDSNPNVPRRVQLTRQHFGKEPAEPRTESCHGLACLGAPRVRARCNHGRHPRSGSHPRFGSQVQANKRDPECCGLNDLVPASKPKTRISLNFNGVESAGLMGLSTTCPDSAAGLLGSSNTTLGYLCLLCLLVTTETHPVVHTFFPFFAFIFLECSCFFISMNVLFWYSYFVLDFSHPSFFTSCLLHQFPNV